MNSVLKSLITAFRAETRENSISPDLLGAILQRIVEEIEKTASISLLTSYDIYPHLLGSNYAVNDQDFRYVIYLGNPMRHDEKYLLINQGFANKQRLMPFFNRQNNDDLILAILSAGVERGRNGFRKNKSMEKNPESEEDLLEHRTDGTDAFDTLYIGCEKFLLHDVYPIVLNGIL